MNTTKLIKVFIGSPTDTAEERSKILGIIEELNQTIGSSNSVRIQSVMWENDVTPTVGEDGQDVINKQTGDYDIFVGMMWKKYGFPTPRAGSGTDEEYSYAYESLKSNGHCKDIIMMFSKIPLTVDDIDPDQIAKVQAFKKRVEKEGIFYKDYKSIDEFTNILRVALYQSINRIVKREKGKSSEMKDNKIIKTSSPQPIDESTKLVFDTLSTSSAVNSVKTNFIESYILLFLYEGNASEHRILEHLCDKLGSNNINIYKDIISQLAQTDVIERLNDFTNYYKLSGKKREEILLLKEKSKESTDSLLKECQAICNNYGLSIEINEIHSCICNLYSSYFSSDSSELSRGTIKREASIKSIYDGLVKYIQTESNLPYSFVLPIAQDLISVYSHNSVFYKSNISKMFLALFQSERLEEYLSSTSRDLILDTQVLLLLCCVTFDDTDPVNPGIMYRVGRRFWEGIKSNDTINLYTTQGYVSELSDHLIQAVNLSRFLSLDYIVDLGPSKNVFFNHYLSTKDDRGYTYFREYVSELLDIDEYDIFGRDFKNIAYRQLYSILENLNITILKHENVKNYLSFKREYENELSYSGLNRSTEARHNDINAAIIAGNIFNDFEGTPYLVTNDSLFVKVRDTMTQKFPGELSYWYVYTPQKISEMLSLIRFKVDPTAVDESIISLAEANFNTSNDTISFVDLLNTFIDSKNLSSWKLAQKLSKIRRLCKENSKHEIIKTSNLPIDEIISQIIKRVSGEKDYSFAELKEAFCDNDYADEISTIIKTELDYYKTGGKVRQKTIDAFTNIIDRRKKK